MLLMSGSHDLQWSTYSDVSHYTDNSSLISQPSSITSHHHHHQQSAVSRKLLVPPGANDKKQSKINWVRHIQYCSGL